jgi:hypothetical protein
MMHWTKEIDRASKQERSFRDRGQQVIDRYLDKRKGADHIYAEDSKTKFNILWSNTETLRPALISATPSPEVRPRYKKKDPTARIAAKIAERAVEFQIDLFNFVEYGRKVVQDYLLPGRGVTRLQYVPTFEKKKQRVPLEMKEEMGETMFVRSNGERVDEYDFDEEGAFVNDEVEELVYEEVRPVRVPWKWFRRDPDADRWEDVQWVAFGAPWSKDEGYNKWGNAFLDAFKSDNNTKEEPEDREKKSECVVWEIWCKRTRKQYFVAEGRDKPLEENDDPLGLENFFPMPEPIYAVEDNDSLVPTPEFTLWQDQADELDRLSERISKVTEAIKARGAYAGEEQHTLSNILHQDDNKLVAVDDWAAFIDKGGLDGLISWVPIEQFAKVLQMLEQQRAVKIQEIYELTGVSDILRGATDPRETAKAQQLKANYGGRRLLTKQQDVQNHFKGVYRIMVEIIVERFSKDTLRMMVGLENQNPLFDEAIKLLRSDAMRAFNIDVETDSTIAADEQKEKEGLAEAMQATSSYVGAIFPLVQTGAIPMPVAMGLLQDYLRKFRFGRKLDDLMEEFKQSQPPNAEQEKQQQEMQAEWQKAMQEMLQNQQEFQQKMQQKQDEFQLEMKQMAEESELKMALASQNLRQDQQKHDQEMRQDEEEHDIKVQNERELGEVKADVQRKQAAARPRVQ